jgi:8-oxo-dGTP pyrophosphatase MutT (NUDIX family)
VLALERSDVPDAWQMPQGGLKPGEEPAQAVLREVEEETGLPRASLEPIRSFPELLAYELPPKLRSKKTGRGQVQYWFFLRLNKGVAEPKYDGFRALGFVTGGGTKLVPRRGLEYRRFDDLRYELALEVNADDAVFDGEIVKRGGIRARARGEELRARMATTSRNGL